MSGKQAENVLAAVEADHLLDEAHWLRYELDLLRRLTQILHGDEDLQGACITMLREICAATGWCYGEAWVAVRAGDDTPVRLAACYGEDRKLAPFHAAGEGITFWPADSLIGNAWSSGEVVCVTDIARAPNVRRRRAALEAGLRSAAAFPVIAHGHAIAVLCFFAGEVRQRDRRLIEVLEHLAPQLGEMLEHQRTQQALRQSHTLLEKTFASLKESVLIIDVNSRIIQACNDAAVQMFGYSRQELVGHDTSRLHVTHAMWEQFGSEAMRELRDSDVFTTEFQMRRRDGSVFVSEHTVMLLRDDEGGMTSVVSVVRDLTERLSFHERVRQQQAELAHVLPMTTVNEIAAGLSHELNQPLGAIRNYASVVADAVKHLEASPRSLHGALEEIVKETERAHQIVGRLRDFVNRRGPRRSATDLNAVVRDAAHMMQVLARRLAVTIRLDLAPHLPTIQADAVQIGQVMVNLVHNALEALREVAAEQRQLQITTAADARGQVRVEVRDSGPGVPDAIREQIFDAFFTTRSEGMGMGLKICRSIVEAHGGSLRCQPNAAGRGAVFALTLPGISHAAAGAKPDE